MAETNLSGGQQLHGRAEFRATHPIMTLPIAPKPFVSPTITDAELAETPMVPAYGTINANGTTVEDVSQSATTPEPLDQQYPIPEKIARQNIRVKVKSLK